MTVGFSYTTSEKDKKFGDDQAAEDNYLVSVVFSVSMCTATATAAAGRLSITSY